MKTTVQPRPKNASRNPPGPTEAEIQKVAYRLWLEAGSPAGRDLDHWLAAKELLRHHHGRTGTRTPGNGPRPLHFPPAETMLHPAIAPAA